MFERTDFTRVPGTQRMEDAVRSYVVDGRPVGDFLGAVIENNLKMAYAYADDENTKLMHAWVTFFWNEVPGVCWGSPEKRISWIKNGGAKGIEARGRWLTELEELEDAR